MLNPLDEEARGEPPRPQTHSTSASHPRALSPGYPPPGPTQHSWSPASAPAAALPQAQPPGKPQGPEQGPWVGRNRGAVS